MEEFLKKHEEMGKKMKRIGILALQGAFEEHRIALRQLNTDSFEIRQKTDLLNCSMDGIILPGGESTVIGRLMEELGITPVLQDMIREGMPVFGTCAGMILLAKEIINASMRYLGLMDIAVRRNAYGRQLGSFQTYARMDEVGDLFMTFIRAPYIEKINEVKGVRVLAKVDGKIVAARQNNILATSFHPELTGDLRVHQYFLSM